MKTFHIQTVVQEYSYEELSVLDKQLVDEAKQQVLKAYAPYSNFQVGAAVALANGKIITGSNQENAAYPSGLCAERTTMFYANAQYPDTAITTIAIAAHNNGDFTDEPISPCGACRQALLESEIRFGTDIKVILYGKQSIYILPNIKSLLPFCFGKENMEK